ncbi:MAG: hypothetical protein O2951_11670 [Bacteroidetes bacterium]|nr:hypothetical protein [Bacteroidota bacterium]
MNELGKRKEKLLKVERSLKSFIETDSETLEFELKKYLKTGAIVGSSLLVGYTIYKILENKNSTEKEEAVGSSQTPRGISYTIKNRIWAAMLPLLFNELSKWLLYRKKELEKSLNEEDEIN